MARKSTKSKSTAPKKDACYNKAVAKYGAKTSAYRSGYMARCRKRRGKIK